MCFLFMMKTPSIVKLSVFILIFIFIVSYRMWLPIPGTFLLVKDDIHKADCIAPLVGDTYFRLKKVVELYNEGYSKNIVVSVLPERGEELREYYNFKNRVLGLKDMAPGEFYLKALEYLGLKTKDIYFTEHEVTSTYDEAIATRDFMLKKGFKSLILITSTYHMRRTLAIFNLVFKGTGIKIYNCTARNLKYDPDHWWLKERDVKAISLEYLSIAYNIFYHFILRRGRTEFDTY